jgi:hypothetical protein
MIKGDKYPCRVCGYNGPNWYQPEVHACPGNPNFTPPPSAGLSEVLSDEDFVKSLDEVWAHSLEAADQSHRALAQRLREVEQKRDKYAERLEITSAFDQDMRPITIPRERWSSQPDGITCRDETIRLQDQRIAQLEAQVAEAEHHCKQAQEAFQAVSNAQPLGPIIGYHTIENQQREIQRLQQQLATAQDALKNEQNLVEAGLNEQRRLIAVREKVEAGYVESLEQRNAEVARLTAQLDETRAECRRIECLNAEQAKSLAAAQAKIGELKCDLDQW